MSTKTNEAAQERSSDDGVIQLRRWGTDLVYMLPSGSLDAARGDSTGRTRELDGKAGLRLDGGRLGWFGLLPCTEVDIGGTTLIAESGRSIELRRFLARILGWSPDRLFAVDLALRAIRVAATRRAALVLYGQEDLVPIAHALHRHAIGADRPFVVCDPRRQDVGESVRAAANYKRAVDAVVAAVGGSLCVRDARLPRDFGQVQEQLREPETRVQLIVCTDKRRRRSAFLAPFIEVPPLAKRKEELGRIVDEYTLDALGELGEPRTSFTSADRDWVLAHEATSFATIERATLRLIALRTSRNVSHAAVRLGMTHVSLWQWIGRRKPPVQAR
jgi:hypothetical protein